MTNHAKRDLMGLAKSVDPGQPARLTMVETFCYFRKFSVYSVIILAN